MAQEIINIQGIGTPLAEQPDRCPICHRSINPTLVFAQRAGKMISADAVAVYRCPSSDCMEPFLVYLGKTSSVWRLLRCVPSEPAAPAFSEYVREMSPNYCDIYGEAYKGEVWGLAQICGVGYRKALEYLIKDYVKARRPGDADKIEKAALGQCIENYVTDPNVKAVARRAVWLGNDEAHYSRKWVEKDLKDLKVLLELVLRWIETEHLTEEALSSMPAARQ